ncbi:class I SAM-dependent methyltransferase [Roseomonas mucosa]|uniref:SAM-dependent methyltransferase n=1 Tax=Roseomonas mucosa TaxID=207340 RepID=UPI0028CDBB56|nr:class I SAM-dependent methyltransferase [Roseomonas mucosa]MDT8278592.1 class I SAM-dependent methyltransferase [Roseomonas mucosa]
MSPAPSSAAKFDASRAGEYAAQSRIALAGYEACHELAACVLYSALGQGSAARILVGGAGGTAQEILVAAPLEPGWHFTAVDPSPPMLASAQAAVDAAGLSNRAAWHLGTVEDLPEQEPFDAATLIGVLHHVPGEEAKLALLKGIAARLHPGAPLILAGNRGAYASRPLFLKAWATRWRMVGASEDDVQAKIGKILQGADPPSSTEEVEQLLKLAGFEEAELFFSSLFWGAWVARRSA